MTQPAPASPSIVPREIPESFFRGLPDPVAPRRHPNSKSQNEVSPMKAMVLYDVIIDDMFLHPDTSVGDTAARLGKSRNTISLIVRSDFFRARWLQRREKFNEDLNCRIQNKMAGVLEKSLDITLEALEKKRDAIPLPILTDINNSLLDRLGYNPQRASGPSTQVVIQNGANNATIATQASPEGLARARDYLKILEGQNASSGPSPGLQTEPSRDGAAESPVVEGVYHRVES